MRNLASIQLIESVEPIPGADAIEKLRVLGWNVVAKKGEHKPGVRAVNGRLDERGNRLSFKVINPRFLLKYDE